MATTAGTRRPTRKGCPNHPIEFKRTLAAAACDPAESVAKLALEHGVNTNLLFRWRLQYRTGMFGTPDPAHRMPRLGAPSDVADRSEGGVKLLPVEIPDAQVDPSARLPTIEIVFACATVRITGSPEVRTLRAVIDTLARRS